MPVILNTEEFQQGVHTIWAQIWDGIDPKLDKFLGIAAAGAKHKNIEHYRYKWFHHNENMAA